MRAQSAISRDLLGISVRTRLAASPAWGKDKDKSRTNKDLAAFRRALLRWYDQNRRDLPWRGTRDPYRIWLSEIMLQQTRVAAVLAHYRVFLERYPNVEALAAASEDAVLAAWSGLGYYRRARSLHQCAKEIVQKYAGLFPQRAAELDTLPGIGRYTAAAIASIAFGETVAVVDGNVERVLQRVVITNKNGLKATGVNLTPAQIWAHAQTLLAISRPGDFNQALMELGATVCVPGEPRCPVCPVRSWCATGQSSQPASRSISSAITVESRGARPGRQRTSVRQVKKEIWCVLNQRNGSILLVERPKQSSLMPGMWELPILLSVPPLLPEAALWRTFRHSITITDYTVHVLRGMPPGSASLPPAYAAGEGKWIATDRVPQIPITGLTRKILKTAGII